MSRASKQQLEEARRLAQGSDYVAAIKQLDELAVDYPNDPWIFSTRAYVNARQGDYQAAIEDMSFAISKRHDEPHFHYRLGQYQFRIGDRHSAIKSFTNTIALCDKFDCDYYRGPAYFFRAETYLMMGQPGRALADCAKIPDGMKTWTNRVRTKADILAEARSARRAMPE